VERDTRIQHLGDDRERYLGGAAPPIFRTSLFTFPDSASLEENMRLREGGRFLYTRVSNPTTRILETKIADLEATESAIAFASGMGAISAVLLGLLSKGDHLVLEASSYSPTLAFARGPLSRFGVEVTFLPAAEFALLDRHLRPTTRLIYLESPASLTFELVDLARVAALARARSVLTACDNSWASPLYQQPSRLGIDLVVHSGTKYIGGHSDLLLGLVAGGGPPMERVRSMAVALGATLSPEDAFLAIRGLRTLPLRMRRHEESALELARRLEGHPRVLRVLHPGLPSFPDHELARRQMQGMSGLFSFLLRGDPRRFVDALRVFSIGVSWGGYESLALPVAATGPPQGADDPRPDIPPGLIRLSVGLEDPRDLIADLDRGFAALGKE
jgi:cystathionine beta-lyase